MTARRDRLPGEARLAAAVLLRAAADLCKAKHRADAMAWFRSASCEFLGFRCCCDLLDIDPAVVLEEVLRK
jgi:hypothetical protein